MSSDDNKKTARNVSIWKVMSWAWELGYRITLPIVIFAIAGRLLDKHFNTRFIFLLAGVFLSFIVSSILVMLKSLSLIKEIENNNSTSDKNI